MSKTHSEKLGAELWEQATQGTFTDVELRVEGGEKILAHRNVVEATCPTLHLLLTQSALAQPSLQHGSPAILDLPFVSVSQCRWALTRLYTGSPEFAMDNLFGIPYHQLLPALMKDGAIVLETEIEGLLDGTSRKRSCLVEELWQLLQSGELTDVELELQGGERRRGHVNILAAISPVLKAMMIHPLRERSLREITLPTVSLEVWCVLEQHAYTGEADITGDNVLEVLNAAEMLQIESLKRDCASFLKAALQDDNCVDILKYAKMFQLSTAFVDEYFCQHFHRICRSEFNLNLDGEEFLTMLRNPEIQISTEDAVCESILYWLKNNRDVDPRLAKAIRDEIRMPDLCTDFLTKRLAKEQLYTSQDENSDKIAAEIKRRAFLGVADLANYSEKVDREEDLNDDRSDEPLEQNDSMISRLEENQLIVQNDSRTPKESSSGIGVYDLELTTSDSGGGFFRTDAEEHRKEDAIEGESKLPQSKFDAEMTEERDVLHAIENLSSPSEPHTRTMQGEEVIEETHADIEALQSSRKLHRRGQAYSPNSYGQNDAIFVLANQGGQLLAKAWSFQDRKWIDLPAPPIDFGPKAAALSYHGNKVMVTGGFKNLMSAHVYCAESRSWTEVVKLPRERMCHKMAVVGDSIYVVGGACHGQPVVEVDAYSEKTAVWSYQGNLCKGVYGVAVATLGDQIIVAGSNDAKEILQVFDTQTITCSVLTNDVPSPGSLCYKGATVGASAWFLSGYGNLIQVTEGANREMVVKYHGHVEDFRYGHRSEAIVHSNGSVAFLGNRDDEEQGRSLPVVNIRPLGPRCVMVDDDVMPLPADMVVQVACRLLIA